MTTRVEAHGWHAWILVISVDPEVHGLVSEVAMKRAFAIRIAWTEDEALQELRNARYKAIFVDVRMQYLSLFVCVRVRTPIHE